MQRIQQKSNKIKYLKNAYAVNNSTHIHLKKTSNIANKLQNCIVLLHRQKNYWTQSVYNKYTRLDKEADQNEKQI